MSEEAKARSEITLGRKELAPGKVAMFGNAVAFKIGDAEFVLVSKNLEQLSMVWRRLFGSSAEALPLDTSAMRKVGIMLSENLREAQWSNGGAEPPAESHQADYAAALREIAKGPHHSLPNDECAAWAMRIASDALSLPPRPSQTKEEYPKVGQVRAHKHTCANVQPGSTIDNVCDCGAVETSAPKQRAFIPGCSVCGEPGCPDHM